MATAICVLALLSSWLLVLLAVSQWRLANLNDQVQAKNAEIGKLRRELNWQKQRQEEPIAPTQRIIEKAS